MSRIIPREYVFPVTVATYDVGPDDRMRLSAILRYQQEAAEQHLAPGGMSWNELTAHGIAFVASRWHVQLTRQPSTGERVVLTTWHRERKGPRFFRCFSWRDAAGEEIIRGVMQYALVAVEDHRLLRGEEFDRFGVTENPGRTVACSDPAKWRQPPLEPTGTLTVRWSDTDRNGHLNNTRYGDLACDALPLPLQGKRLTDVQLYFAGEARQGDEMTLASAVQEGVAYVSGTTARGAAFAARMEMDHGL